LIKRQKTQSLKKRKRSGRGIKEQQQQRTTTTTTTKPESKHENGKPISTISTVTLNVNGLKI